ncbi:MAG: FAD-containing oxidoreductase [Gammaproteobacteria bacterium]|nr:MAG: FAD-containing oxidoreductase [Gammaproteobacteria bacterium]
MNAYDAIIIGTGQAGPALAERLAKAGMRVAIVERGRFGGTCVNNGCTPTKTLVASAYVAQLARRAAEYGVDIPPGPVKVDPARIKARKDALVQRSTQGLEKWLRSLENVTVYRGHARFHDSQIVKVGADTLSGKRVFINAGGRPFVPNMPGVERVAYLTNESMMDIDFLPEHLIVVGGSYVGLEFGQMYRRFGSLVMIVEMGPRLIGREDAEVSDAVRDILAAEDIEIRLNAECLALEPTGDGILMRLDCTDGAPTATGTHVLLAVGRVPNTDDLGLKEAGIEVDALGYIKVDDTLRTSVDSVYALGDCNGRGAFTHTAWNDYEIVADNLLSGANRKVSDRIAIYALFTDPPLGRVGMSEAEARRAGRKLLIGRMPMTEVSRAREKGETQGFMKVLVDAESRQIVGAAILGVGGDEVVHSLVDAMYARLPYTAVQHGVRIHPTVSELIPTLLGELTPAA